MADQSLWDVVIADDGNGEVVDIVALRIDESGIIWSSSCTVSTPVVISLEQGWRTSMRCVEQASKSVTWRRAELAHFFRYLDRRAQRKRQRTGVSPFVVGDEREFYRTQKQTQVQKIKMEVVIAQLGLSASLVSAGRLDLPASTEAYLKSTVNAGLRIWCSS